MQWLNLEDNINLLALIGAILTIAITVVIAGKYVGQMKTKKDDNAELSEYNWDDIGEYKNPIPVGWAVVFLLMLVWQFGTIDRLSVKFLFTNWRVQQRGQRSKR